MRLLLLRHGQTTANVHGALDTAFPGRPLTDLGRAQAAAVPAALAEEDVSALYCSNLTRTRQTAEPLRAETSLSYFGLGIQAPDVSLGTLLQDGTSAAVSRPWLFIFPAAFLVALLTAVSLVGDALRDALDPTSGTDRA